MTTTNTSGQLPAPTGAARALTAAAATAAVAGAAATPAAPAGLVPVDEHHGLGGSYEVVDGQRVLVERTQPGDEDEDEDHPKTIPAPL